MELSCASVVVWPARCTAGFRNARLHQGSDADAPACLDLLHIKGLLVQVETLQQRSWQALRQISWTSLQEGTSCSGPHAALPWQPFALSHPAGGSSSN